MCFASKSAGANAPKPCGKAYRLWCYDALPSTVALWLRTVEGARFSDSFDTHTPFSSFSLRSIQRGVLRLSVRLYLVAGAKKYTVLLYGVSFYPSDALLSQAAARQVSSAPQSLTTVFGMGTGVSSALLSLSFLNTIHLSYLL